MVDGSAAWVVGAVSAREPDVQELLAALTAELATGGYSAEQTFGYSVEQIERSGVHLVGARVGADLVAVAGLEPQTDGVGELKRFFVSPPWRGRGVADGLMTALLARAAELRLGVLRLETGDRQAAALAFYRRHGFTPVARFPPYQDSATSVCLERRL
ncbi:GNAT family N-acetyltransferase [Microlunatus capsulatus]|uniref:Acetyltransferase n=1 Tax=Microlunatus capsulatus TaxID=99117 RepID=A0ABS4Z336_9ACTN|nr:GNAT family N-acetyltransferase [Microlunatus capsulatus]MBP2415394.1 putative acetyltransferase [Microlunatus capsulatus]